MTQQTIDSYLDVGCPHRKVSDHNGYAYCYSPDHLSKWAYACSCPPYGCGDPPNCPEESDKKERIT